MNTYHTNPMTPEEEMFEAVGRRAMTHYYERYGMTRMVLDSYNNFIECNLQTIFKNSLQTFRPDNHNTHNGCIDKCS